MLSNSAKEIFEKMELPYPAVAMKFLFEEPAGVEKAEEVQALCGFIKTAQSGRKFYISAENENCMGKVWCGMIECPKLECSGQAGMDFEVFRTQAANARLYYEAPMLIAGTVKYIMYAPVSMCDFDPDLIICVADTRCTDLLMRANSYTSGDLWESKSSHVASCAWQYVYPYLSGKMNHTTVGIYHGQKIRKPFPDGMQIITIPYQKINEVVQSLIDMPWVPISLRPEDQDELQRRIDHWAEMEPDLVLKQS